MEYNPQYYIGNHSLERVRNKNETRVIRFIETLLSEFQGYEPTEFDLDDIYALSLNKLPARYKQQGSVVIREQVTDEEMRQQIRAAIKTVRDNPKIK